MRLRRGARPRVDVGPGEAVLAWAETPDGTILAGTRDAAYLDVERLPWEQVETADWDRDSEVFRVQEVGRWGEPRRLHTFLLPEPGRFLELVRERVTASVVLQRRVQLAGGWGVRVVARRAPGGDRALAWFFEYDEGVDPEDPGVREAAEATLRAAQEDVGAG